MEDQFIRARPDVARPSLAVERDLGGGFIAHLQKERAGAAGRIVHRGIVASLGVVDAHDLGDDSAYLGGV